MAVDNDTDSTMYMVCVLEPYLTSRGDTPEGKQAVLLRQMTIAGSGRAARSFADRFERDMPEMYILVYSAGDNERPVMVDWHVPAGCADADKIILADATVCMFFDVIGAMAPYKVAVMPDLSKGSAN